MKKIISTLVLILVIIGLVIGLIFACKTIVNKNAEILQLNQENKDLKDTITNLNNTINNFNISKDNVNKDEDKKEEPKSELNFFFDSSKVVNKEENTAIIEEITDDMEVLSISVDKLTNSLNLNLDKEFAKLVYGYNGESDSHTVTGFSQNIIDAKIAIVGTTINDLKVVMLMQDGSVKYISIDSILDKTYTVKTIDEKDFVKIVKVNIKNSEKGTTEYAVAGLKKDGTSAIIKF